MSITDELRGFADDWDWLDPKAGESPRKLRAIADRIDAEHEAKVSYWQGASYKDGYDDGFASADDWLGQHEDAMAMHGWVRLPKDADGVPIRVGDVMESKGSDFLFDEASFEVRAMRYDEGGWEVYDRLGDRYAPSLLRHGHAPTVEDVLREFADIVRKERVELATISEDTIAEYAAKLRLAGDGDE